MRKIRVTAIPRKPVDSAGLLAVLVDLALEKRRTERRESAHAVVPADDTPKKEAKYGA